MKRTHRFLTMALAMACTVSCSLEEMDSSPASGNDFDHVSILAHNFEFEGVQTKTFLNMGGSGVNFSWTSGDIVGIFPNIAEGTQVRFPITSNNDNQNTQSAEFDGNGWAVKGATRYMGYYPFISDMELDKTAIPVDYTGQTQDGNDNPAHVYPIDFMAAASTAPEDFRISFDFNHLSSIFVFDLTVPKPGIYETFTLSCEDKEFVTKGSVDITADNICIAPSETSHSFTVNLKNLETTTTNQTIRLYTLLPPGDFRGSTINVRMRGPQADFETGFDGGNYKAGKGYWKVLASFVGGDIIHLEPGPQFNVHIKSLVNGRDYLLDKYDYNIQNIYFSVNNPAAPEEGLRYRDVSAQDSPDPIYAIWHEDTGSLEIRTGFSKVLANEDASHMFHKLAGMTSIDLTGFDTIDAENMESLFHGCERLEALDLSGFNTEKVYNFLSLLQDCRSLRVLDISSLDVQNAVELRWMFANCEKLESIDISHFRTTRSLINIGGMFGGCKSLKSMAFGEGFDTSNVLVFIDLFNGCTSLETVDVSHLDYTEGHSMHGLFGNCSSLKEIIGAVWAGGGQFSGCRSLTSVKLLGTKDAGTGGLFYDCSSLTDIDFGPDWDFSRITDASNMFAGCTSLTSIDMTGWDTSNCTNMAGMFNGCSSLTAIDVTGFDTSACTNFGEMFKDCSGLSTIDLTRFNTANATSMRGMFEGCSSLSSLDLTHFNTAKVTDMSYMFLRCSSLTSLDLSSFNTSMNMTFWEFLSECTSLNNVTFGAQFDVSYCEQFFRMFYNTAFTELDLSFMNTASARRLDAIIENMPYLRKVNVPGFSSAHLNPNVNNFLFKDCPCLEEIHFGRGMEKQLIETWGSFASGELTIYCTPEYRDLCLADDYLSHLTIHWFDITNDNAPMPDTPVGE